MHQFSENYKSKKGIKKNSLSFSLSLSLSICLSLYLPVSLYLCLCLSPFIHLCQFISQSFCFAPIPLIFLYLYVCLSFFLSFILAYLSLFFYICTCIVNNHSYAQTHHQDQSPTHFCLAIFFSLSLYHSLSFSLSLSLLSLICLTSPKMRIAKYFCKYF